MSLARTKLGNIAQIAAAAASLLANAASTKTYVRSITLFNGNTTPELVKLYNVPGVSGALGSAALANQFLEVSLAVKETMIIDWAYPIVLTATNDSIQGSTTTASKVTIMFHGDTDP